MRTFLLVPILVGLASCYSEAAYRGDGVLSDGGFRTASDRYVLTLDRITDRISEYRLENLPDERFAVGLQVAGLDLDAARSEAERHNVEIDLALTTDDGTEVFREKAPLANWVWTSGAGVDGDSSSFAYRRGQRRGTPLPDGGEQVRAVGVGPHDGWGTYFRPRRGEAYRLKVTIGGSSFLVERDVHVVVRGGGWK